MLGQSAIDGIIPIGGGIRVTAYRRILLEVFGLSLNETVNVDEYCAFSCTTFERLLHEKRLHLSDAVLDHAVFNISSHSAEELAQQMHEQRDWELDLDISRNVVDMYSNNTGTVLSPNQLQENDEIIRLLHLEEQEMASVSNNCVDIENMLFELAQKGDQTKVREIQQFLRRRRVDITRDEAIKQRHDIRILLGLSRDETNACLSNSLSKSWSDWIDINASVITMRIADESFATNRRQEFHITDRPRLEEIWIGEKCFSHFVTFTVDSLPALKKLTIGASSFNAEKESGTFSVKSCHQLKSIQIDPYSFEYFREFILQGIRNHSL